MWPLRLTLAKLRPLDGRAAIRLSIIGILFASFLAGDFLLFRRLFQATGQVEAMSPLLAAGLVRNLLAMVFLIAMTVLFSSAMTSAIGAFFTSLDLDIYHSSPRRLGSIILARWVETLGQSSAIVFVFLLPLFAAFASQYGAPRWFYPVTILNLAMLLTIPVSLASLVIVVLVRFFPVARVNQVVVTIAILVLTTAVVGFRMSRPERFFAAISTDDAARVLRTIDLPSMELYPSTALAEVMVNPDAGAFPPKIILTATILFALFMAVASRLYFTAFVRARESMAPAAIGAAGATALIDRMLKRVPSPQRALLAKEVRILSRDVAQWSQLFLMVALLFIYLYNIRMLPIGGDVRATLVAYANLGMAGFVIAAISLRFAYPAVSTEGKAFWLVETAPVSARQLLRAKVIVYAVPLTILSLLLTAIADFILEASSVVWLFTMGGASMLAVTLVSLGVGMGSLSPDFNAENPLQVGLSLGGFGYMALSLTYVGAMMVLMARPLMAFVMTRLFGMEGNVALLVPIVTAITVSVLLTVSPLLAAEKQLERRRSI